MKSTDILSAALAIAVFLFCHTFIITVLINNAFKTVQQSAKTRKIYDAEFHTLMGLDYDALFTRTAIDASIFVDFRMHHRHVGKI